MWAGRWGGAEWGGHGAPRLGVKVGARPSVWPQWPLLAEIQGPRSLEKSQAKSLEHRGALRIHPAGGALRRAVRDAPVPAGRVARWGAGKEGCPAPEHFLLASHALGVWRSAHLCSGVRRRHLYRSEGFTRAYWHACPSGVVCRCPCHRVGMCAHHQAADVACDARVSSAAPPVCPHSVSSLRC